MSAKTPIWQKEGARPESWVTRFTVGEDYLWDRILLPFDLTASAAHAWGLSQAGILSGDELAAVEEALEMIRVEHAEGTLSVTQEDEDCHTVIERRLMELAGDTGARIHTGRSRNDQVLAALRLFLREQMRVMGDLTGSLGRALCQLADDAGDVFLPGYTHMQRAMPSTAALWALGYAELVADDLRGLGYAAAAVNVSPLGSAAGYGVPYLNLPREAVARRLGFEGARTHVTAVQLSRGKVEMGVVHAALQVAGTINRMASDLVLYNTAEFGFVTLPEAYSTGSSIMPQKKNPDVLELARATYHRVLAEFQLLAGLPANLPSGYHRDLQLTKESVMRAVLRVEDLLTAMNALIPGVTFDAAAARRADDPALHATAAALKLVREGIPFREAYRRVAGDRSAWEAAQEDPAAYGSVGDPGREDAGSVRERLRDAGAWMA